jgi:hypothetical protein
MYCPPRPSFPSLYLSRNSWKSRRIILWKKGALHLYTFCHPFAAIIFLTYKLVGIYPHRTTLPEAYLLLHFAMSSPTSSSHSANSQYHSGSLLSPMSSEEQAVAQWLWEEDPDFLMQGSAPLSPKCCPIPSALPSTPIQVSASLSCGASPRASARPWRLTWNKKRNARQSGSELNLCSMSALRSWRTSWKWLSRSHDSSHHPRGIVSTMISTAP